MADLSDAPGHGTGSEPHPSRRAAMLHIRKVLFPTDFSASSQQALLHAVNFAGDHGAELHILHAIVLHEDDPHNPAHHLPDPSKIQGILEDLAEERMGSLVRETIFPTLDVKLARRRDVSAGPAIVDYAVEEEIDLIVMGTHGRRGVRKWLMGSVTNEVVRSAPCSVLTVRSGGDPVPVEPIERILIPIDFSEPGKSGLGVACALASTVGADLHLVHVLPVGPYPPFSAMAATLPGDFEPGILERIRTSLAELVEKSAGCQGVSAGFFALEGHAGQEIVRFSKDHDTSLIVVPTHGWSGLRHLMLGSTAERVIAAAECPVLVLRPSGRSLLG